MKILWVVNCVLPCVGKKLGISYNGHAGWIEGQLENLRNSDYKIEVVSVSDEVRYCDSISKSVILDNIKYTVIATGDGENRLLYFKEYISELSDMVDVIHIHGSENSTTIATLENVDVDKTVISIQGLTHICYEAYMKDFVYTKSKNIITRILPDFYFTKKTLCTMKECAKREEKALKLAKNVMGRTTWDKVCTNVVNPRLNYFYCSEQLRKPFYESKKWDINHIEKYSIFLSQIGSPIKGFDKFLMAFSLVIQEFPDAKVYVGCGSFNSKKGLKGMVLNSIVEWNSEINWLLDIYSLRNNIVFLNDLDVNEMIEYYLKSNVFVSTSRIENSSNSICEAKILGVPCISSFVGGCNDIIEHGKDGFLYDFSEYRMCAHYIKEIFKNPNLAMEISRNAIISGEKYNSAELNRKCIDHIYNTIKKQE